MFAAKIEISIMSQFLTAYIQNEFPERLFLLDNFVSKFVFQKNIGEEKNSLYHGLSVSVIIEDTFQFTVNAKYNICFGKQFIQNGGNICFKQGIIV